MQHPVTHSNQLATITNTNMLLLINSQHEVSSMTWIYSAGNTLSFACNCSIQRLPIILLNIPAKFERLFTTGNSKQFDEDSSIWFSTLHYTFSLLHLEALLYCSVIGYVLCVIVTKIISRFGQLRSSTILKLHIWNCVCFVLCSEIQLDNELLIKVKMIKNIMRHTSYNMAH